MRIAVNATAVGGRYNGVTTATEALLECLCMGDHEVFVYSSAPRFGTMRNVTLRDTPAQLAFDGGGLTSLKRFWWLQNSFPSMLQKDAVQLLISPSVEGLIRPALPQVITVHDLIPLRYREENPRLYYYYRYILPKILARSRVVLAVSEFTRQDIVNQYDIEPERVCVAPAGIRQEFFEAADSVESPAAEPYFLFIGTFAPRKNLQTIVRALAKIAKDAPENLAVVAYPDAWKRQVSRLVAELGISSRLTYYSGIGSRELMALYRGATAMVLVSEYEGFGLPPVEAMALGTPTIVSNSTSLAEVVGDAAVKVGCKDLNALASAMKALSTNPLLRQKLREKGLRRAASFNRMCSIGVLNRALQSVLLEPTCA